MCLFRNQLPSLPRRLRAATFIRTLKKCIFWVLLCSELRPRCSVPRACRSSQCLLTRCLTMSVRLRPSPIDICRAIFRPQDSQAVLGGAVAVLMLGALASSLKLTFGSSGEGTQSLLTASQRSDGSPDDSRSSLSGLNREGAPGSQQAWWTANNVFLVTEAPHPQDPASASPVLIRTAHGEVLAVFEVLFPRPVHMQSSFLVHGATLPCNLTHARSCLRQFADRSICSSIG